jgi:hypothetical protein
MAAWHGVALAGALLALLCLPCAVALLVHAPNQAAIRRTWRRDPVTLELLRRLDSRLKTRRADTVVAIDTNAPCAEQISAELVRLRRLRHHGLANQSEEWMAAVNRAYDRWLCQGCQALGINEELLRLEGLDRELERARIEDVLRDKGF